MLLCGVCVPVCVRHLKVFKKLAIHTVLSMLVQLAVFFYNTSVVFRHKLIFN